MLEANSFLVSLYPQSAAKVVITGGNDYQAIDNFMCFTPDFKEHFKRLYKQYNTIKEIYVVGPKDYIKPFISFMKNVIDKSVRIVEANNG